MLPDSLASTRPIVARSKSSTSRSRASVKGSRNKLQRDQRDPAQTHAPAQITCIDRVRLGMAAADSIRCFNSRTLPGQGWAPARRWLPASACVQLQECNCEWQDIFATLTQRRDREFNAAQTKVKILSKQLVVDRLFQVLMSSADNSYVDSDNFFGADGLYESSWSTRKRRVWTVGGISPISSKNNVPPSAWRNTPSRARSAPVKAPRAWPNNSLSTKDSAIAAVFTATNGPAARGPL